MKQTRGALFDMPKMYVLVSACLMGWKQTWLGKEFHTVLTRVTIRPYRITETFPGESIGFGELTATQTWSRYTGFGVPWPDVPTWTDMLDPPQQIYEGAKTSSHGTYTAQTPANGFESKYQFNYSFKHVFYCVFIYISQWNTFLPVFHRLKDI